MEFLDTNVLVYAASDKVADQAKAAVARELLRRGPSDFAISLQVLQEFYVAARAPRKLGLVHEEALKFCGQWRAFALLEPTLGLFEAALEVCRRYQIGYYDAAILAAARQLGCTKVHSEDLNDGQDYDGVRVENPFREIPSTPQP
ncbi:MAG: PIN domain-containing protein [Gemmataceae bacterium]